MTRSFLAAICLGSVLAGHVAELRGLAADRDITAVPPDLEVPPMRGDARPMAGQRVRQVTRGYEQTDVYHALYLPIDWQPGGRYPVLVEFAGNGPYSNRHGDVSSGRLEHSELGYGLSGGERFIWICMPFLNGDGTATVSQWWGTPPTYAPRPTVDYCQRTVADVCATWGGDPEAVVLIGFSRGAIACNYMGLYDDEIASLWRAFIAYSHYDGVVDTWPYPDCDREAAIRRLQRLAGRPQLVLSEDDTDGRTSLKATQAYLESTGVDGAFAFMATGFRNHDDAWVLRPSATRTAARKWLADVLARSQ